MAAARFSSLYSPLDMSNEHEISSHRSNVSDASDRSVMPQQPARSFESGELASENLASPFSPQTLVNGSWHGGSDSPTEKHAEKTTEHRIQDGEASSTFSTSSTDLGGGSWLLEIISLLASISAIAAIVGVLAHFNGQSLPHWPEQITLNTLVALLSALATASIAAPLSSGLSQLKWIHFKGQHRPLTDMVLFDDASRGFYGSIKLLVFGRGGILGSFGAIVTIVALAMGPFAQQIVAYRTRMVEAHAAASIKTASNYTAFLPGDSRQSDSFVPILPLKAAVFNGMFSASDPTTSLAVECPTGNCTWPSFSTLAVSSSCISMTEYMTRSCGKQFGGNGTDCGWELPSGAILNTNSSVFSMSSQTPSPSGSMAYTDIVKLTFMGTEAQDGAVKATNKHSNPWATQCTLQYCVQTLNTTVHNGVTIQNVTATFTNTSAVDISNDLQTGTNVPGIITAGDNTTYLIGMGAMLGIQQWFDDIFRNGSASRSSDKYPRNQESNIIVNLTVGVSSGETFFDTDMVQAFYWYYYEYPSGLSRLTSELAQSMTNSFRSSGGAVPVLGAAFEAESYVHIRWGWIALPVAVVLLTAFFLAAAIFRSRRSGLRLWKSSALAMLYHGLDGETKNQCRERNTLKGVLVRLDEELGEGGPSLVRV